MAAGPGTPAAIFVPGRGPITRNGDQVDATHGTALLLATGLLQREISSLIFDKRGIGASIVGDGKAWDKSTMMEEADDIQCLVRWVVEHKHPSQMTLIGYNDGGVIAAIAATVGVDRIVMLPVFEGGAGDMLNDMRSKGLAEPAVAEIERAVASRLRGETATYSNPVLHRPVEVIVQRIQAMRPPLDRIDVLRQLNVPVLLVRAGWDFETSPNHFKRLAESTPRSSVFYGPRMNSLLRTYTVACSGICKRERESSREPLDLVALAAISSFVARGKVGTEVENCHTYRPGAERAR